MLLSLADLPLSQSLSLGNSACAFFAAFTYFVQANTSIHWHTLEKGKGPAAAGVAVAAPAAPQQEQAPPANVRQYPSSKGPKDWSKVEGERAC
jgi:hypothetical protein